MRQYVWRAAGGEGVEDLEWIDKVRFARFFRTRAFVDACTCCVSLPGCGKEEEKERFGRGRRKSTATSYILNLRPHWQGARGALALLIRNAARPPASGHGLHRRPPPSGRCAPQSRCSAAVRHVRPQRLDPIKGATSRELAQACAPRTHSGSTCDAAAMCCRGVGGGRRSRSGGRHTSQLLPVPRPVSFASPSHLSAKNVCGNSMRLLALMPGVYKGLLDSSWLSSPHGPCSAPAGGRPSVPGQHAIVQLSSVVDVNWTAMGFQGASYLDILLLL